jgi:hypothetical protein
VFLAFFRILDDGQSPKTQQYCEDYFVKTIEESETKK